MVILGLSFFYHDSSATLLKDGEILGAIQEERFSRKKHDNRFPVFSIKHLLYENNLSINEIDAIVYYENPYLKFRRILYSFALHPIRGAKTFPKVLWGQLKEKLWIKRMIRKKTGFNGKIYYVKHHDSHAASAFYPSPFSESAFLTIDGVGEYNTLTYGIGKNNNLKFLGEVNFPHSLGLLYSAFTYFTGFKVNSGEYKVMGLAPYGEPKYVKLILDNLIDIKDDGTFKINMDYFDYETGEKMINEKFCRLFERETRKPESKLTQDDMDLARSIQDVIEIAVLKIGEHVKKATNQKDLCMAGGVALNCVANGKLLRSGLFENIWIQPASGDAGCSLGATLFFWHKILGNKRTQSKENFNPYLGPEFKDEDVKEFLVSNYIPYKKEENIEKEAAKLLADGNVVGWFQGKMEFGPRALGNRSILGHPGLTDMQKKMNLKIKFRESFRPFAPAILEEHLSHWFSDAKVSPFMLLVFDIKEDKRIKTEDKNLFGIDKLNQKRSLAPAITHIDYSARVQSVSPNTNPKFYSLIKNFYNLTKMPIVVNTSFNVRGEPIVCTPEDAYRCFMRTDMDYLALGNFLIKKSDQRDRDEQSWKELYELD